MFRKKRTENYRIFNQNPLTNEFVSDDCRELSARPEK